MTEPSNQLLRMSSVTKIYKTDEVETHAVKDFDLDICQGEFLAIRGKSGSGKSTLLSILGTLEVPTQGTYLFQNENVLRYTNSQLSLFRSSKLGFIFQSFYLVDNLTALENVMLAMRGLKTNKPLSSLRSLAVKALSDVEMDHRLNHFPYQLSGGQQQRVAIARALVNRPSLVLADEPTGNLDTENSNKIMEILKAKNREGCTICVVTHDDDVSYWADTVVTMKDGRVITESGV